MTTAEAVEQQRPLQAEVRQVVGKRVREYEYAGVRFGSPLGKIGVCMSGSASVVCYATCAWAKVRNGSNVLTNTSERVLNFWGCEKAWVSTECCDKSRVMEGEGGARRKPGAPPLSLHSPSSSANVSEGLTVPQKVSRATSPFSFGRSRKQHRCKKLEKQSTIPDEFIIPTSPLSIAPGGCHASYRDRCGSTSKDRFAEFRRRSKAQASSLKGV